MYEAPYTLVRNDRRFSQEFDYITDVARMLKKHKEDYKNRGFYWFVFDARGFEIPHSEILCVLDGFY